MKAILTRSSVCAGDDVDATHWKEIELTKTLERLDYDKTGRLKIHFNYHEQKNPRVTKVTPEENYCLLLEFSNGERRERAAPELIVRQPSLIQTR